MHVQVTGTDLLPFTTQKQTLVLAVLKQLFQVSCSAYITACMSLLAGGLICRVCGGFEPVKVWVLCQTWDVCTMQMNGLPARTQAILPSVHINPREANASASVAAAPAAAPAENLSSQRSAPAPRSSSPARRLLAQSGATLNGTEELHVIIRCRMYPVSQPFACMCRACSDCWQFMSWTPGFWQLLVAPHVLQLSLHHLQLVG